MKCIGLAAAVVVLHQVHAVSAYACAPLPAVVSPLLPLDGATDVGVDAVLIATGNAGEPLEFELLTAAFGDAGQDAGGEKVDLTVECGQGAGGCIAKPVAPLVSHGRYEWRVRSSSAGSSDWRSFVTSDVRTVPFELPSVEARVVSESIGSNCGDFQIWEVQGGEFDGPAVFSASGGARETGGADGGKLGSAIRLPVASVLSRGRIDCAEWRATKSWGVVFGVVWRL